MAGFRTGCTARAAIPRGRSDHETAPRSAQLKNVRLDDVAGGRPWQHSAEERVYALSAIEIYRGLDATRHRRDAVVAAEDGVYRLPGCEVHRCGGRQTSGVR